MLDAAMSSFQKPSHLDLLLVQILQVKYVPGSTFFHLNLREVGPNFSERVHIFCSKEVPGVPIYQKISSEGKQLWGSIFTMTGAFTLPLW